MGSLSRCQFKSYQPGIGSIKHLSIPFCLWNLIWLTSLPTGRRRYKRPHTDKPVDGHLCVCVCEYVLMYTSAQPKAPKGQEWDSGCSCSWEEDRKKTAPLTRLLDEDETMVESFRGNRSSLNVFLCSPALVMCTAQRSSPFKSTEMISSICVLEVDAC